MDEDSDFTLSRHCCTCLSADRTLTFLYRVPNGVNNLFSLLSSDPDVYRESFHQNTAKLRICWECSAILKRFDNFRQQACLAQSQLSCENKSVFKCLSNLTIHHTSNTHHLVEATSATDDYFVDCGPDTHDSDDEVSLAKLFRTRIPKVKSEDQLELLAPTETDVLTSNKISEYIVLVPQGKKAETLSLENKRKKVKKKEILSPVKTKKAYIRPGRRPELSEEEKKNYFNLIQMTENERLESVQRRKGESKFVGAQFKCELCIETLNCNKDLEWHNSVMHIKKEEHARCAICECYVKEKQLDDHTSDHYKRFDCRHCDMSLYTITDMLRHLRQTHDVENLKVYVPRKKGVRLTPKTKNPGSRPRINPVIRDEKTPLGFSCTKCDQYFRTRKARWKHIERHHSPGYNCCHCGKHFYIKCNLVKHEQRHVGPRPLREPCPVCNKMIRTDLLKKHSLLHSADRARDKIVCLECDKWFSSRACYEHHVRKTRAHADIGGLFKYQCEHCAKSYRSKGELADHIDYLHLGKQHKCPICDKALASKRYLNRHIRRAHEKTLDKPKNHICQQCGKAFGIRKSLREHELIHTGARPLSCAECGATFRQNAALYTHRRRLHGVQFKSGGKSS